MSHANVWLDLTTQKNVMIQSELLKKIKLSIKPFSSLPYFKKNKFPKIPYFEEIISIEQYINFNC